MNSETGLFGPDSMVWRIHRHPAMLVGGLRALLLQALHPLAMAGVREHSDYRADPWARYRRTRDYIVMTSFGSRADAESVAARVVEIHNHIHGTDYVTGDWYDANAAELLLWVHNCLVDSFLSSHERYVEALDDRQVAQYLTEMARASELVLLPPHLVAKSRSELTRYFHDQEETMMLTEAAKEGSRVILSPPMFPLLKPFWWGIALGAVELLPERAIELYQYDRLLKFGPISHHYNHVLQYLGQSVLGDAIEVRDAYKRWETPDPHPHRGWLPGLQRRILRTHP